MIDANDGLGVLGIPDQGALKKLPFGQGLEPGQRGLQYWKTRARLPSSKPLLEANGLQPKCVWPGRGCCWLDAVLPAVRCLQARAQRIMQGEDVKIRVKRKERPDGRPFLRSNVSDPKDQSQSVPKAPSSDRMSAVPIEPSPLRSSGQSLATPKPVQEPSSTLAVAS